MQPGPADPGLLALNPYEARTAAAMFERMFPADENGRADEYRVGLASFDRAACRRHDRPFAECAPAEQDALLAELEAGTLDGFRVPPPRDFFAMLRQHLQPDTLPYHASYLELDPRHRDRSGLGLPLLRITYDMQHNAHRMSEFREGEAEKILRTMGAARTWRGPRFAGVVSSHELGGCRMGHDPATSVADPDLAVHDTPGLHVFGTAVFPSCHGVNPTLTMWAVCARAAERLAARLRG